MVSRLLNQGTEQWLGLNYLKNITHMHIERFWEQISKSIDLQVYFLI